MFVTVRGFLHRVVTVVHELILASRSVRSCDGRAAMERWSGKPR